MSSVVTDYDTLMEGRMVKRVSRHTSCWRRFLYVINTVAVMFAITMFGLGVWYIASTEMRIAVDQWVYLLALSLGVIVLAVSILGIIGTCTAPRFIVRQQCNHWMFFYQLFIIAAVLAILIATFTFLGFIRTIDGARAVPPTPHGVQFVNNINAWKLKHDKQWESIEKLFECCGFSSPDENPRAECSTARPIPAACKDVIFHTIETKLVAIGVIGVFFAFSLLTALLGSCCIVWNRPSARANRGRRHDDETQAVLP